MAFVCPPKLDAEHKTQMLHDLKSLIGKLENELTVSVDPVCMPVCVPVCPPMPCPCPPPEEEKPICEIPDSMICYKVNNKQANKKKNKHDKTDNEVVHRVKESTSRELRSSILYKGCDCERRNGLQDDCPRSDCHGAPPCLTKPSPTCGPSAYCDGKHLSKIKKGKASHGNGGSSDLDGADNGDSSDATYVCFPAKINPPRMCMPCVMPPDCCCPK